MLTLILSLIGGFAGAYIANYIHSRRRFKLSFDEKKKEIRIEDESAPEKFEVYDEMTEKEYRDFTHPMKNFLDTFK